MNTEVRKNTKSDFEKDIFELMNNAVFRNSMKNVINHSDTKLATTESRTNCWCQNQTIIQHKKIQINLSYKKDAHE